MSNIDKKDYKVSIDSIIGRFCVKYNKLDDLVYSTFNHSPAENSKEVNIFIDLNSVLHPVFSENNHTVIDNYTDITSNIINMIGHYRVYFKNLNVKTKFFLIFSYNTCDLYTKFLAEYNSLFKTKTNILKYKTLAEDNFKLMNILCPYLPDIFFIRSVRNYETSVIISYIIEKHFNNNIPNIIISKELYPVQLCKLHPYTAFLKPMKSKDKDVSLMVPIREKKEFIYYFWRFIADDRKMTDDQFLNTFDIISPINYPLVMALTGYKERGIFGAYCHLKTAISLIYEMIEDADIKITPQQLYSNEYFIKNFPVNIIESRMNVLDASFMRSYYDNDPESKSIKFDNLDDRSAVNLIDSKFFQTNPLALDRIYL